MKRKELRGLILIPLFTLLAALVPAISGSNAAYAAGDFEISDSVLTNYSGKGGAVAIPSGKVTAIADYAFYGCSNITSLTVPEGVKSIGKQAFFNCSGMTSLSLPASVRSIGELCFNGCQKLQSISVPASSGYFSSEDGVLFNYGATTLIRCPEGFTDTEYTVPESVTTIDSSAFSRCLSLKRVNLPSGLNLIRDRAFYEDVNLSSMIIPASVAAVGSEAFRSTGGIKTLSLEAVSPSFGSDAFKSTGVSRVLYAGTGSQWGDADLSDVFGGSVKVYYGMSGMDVEDDVLLSYSGAAESVSVPGFIVKIGESAFYGCDSVRSLTLPTSLKYICQSAFDGCSSLERVTIPSSVVSIGEWAFDGCYSLAKISVVSDNAYYSSSGGALYDRDRTTLLRCPPALSVESFTVPSTVTKIGDSAFSLCDGIKNVVIPSGVTEIDHYAFDQCSSLTEISIPASVKSVGRCAFRMNGSLTCVRLGSVSTSFGNGAFSGSPVARVLYPGTEAQWNSVGLGSVFGSARVYYSISDFEIDGSSLVSYKGSADSVTIPDFIEKIANRAFYGNSKIRSVTIPSGVTSIGESAFAQCGSLTGISIPASVTSVGKWAFDGCGKLSSITVPSASANYSSSDGVLYNKDKSSLLRYPPNKAGGSFAIPSSVRTIGDSAFASCRNLTEISVPSGVRNIEQYAFDQCVSLKSVRLAATVTSVGQYAFRSNYGLKTVVIMAKSPSVSGSAFHSDSVAAVCFAGSAAQWDSAGLSGAFGGGAAVYCDYRYPAITLQPESVSSVAGKSVTFSVGADGSGLKYQWYFKKAGQDSFSLWKGHTAASETVAPNDTWNGIRLRCSLTDAAGITVTSSEATVTLSSAIVITTQPKDISAEKGSSVTLSVGASGSGLKYQWYFKKSGQDSFSLWKNRTHSSETVTPNDTWDGIQLYCVIKDSYGNSLKSGSATVTLREPLRITSQPRSATVQKGGSVTLSVSASGSGLKYQWYFKKSGQNSFSLWKNRTHSSETVTPNDTWDGIQLYCIVTDAAGAYLKSETVTVRIN